MGLTGRYGLVSIAIFLSCNLLAQYSDNYVFVEPRNDDYVYRDYIKSVRLYPDDSQIDYPIIELNSGSQLVLEFDDLDAYPKNYSYKVIHCNADWTPSEDISEIDYIDGYAEDRIYESEGSFNTIVPYEHYELRIPNNDVSWLYSGNYLLKVFENGDEDELIITRRFMVVDTKMKVVPDMRRSATPPYAATHQEILFDIQHAGISIGNPTDELSLAILQNGRWDNAITEVEATSVRAESVSYDWQGRVVFPGVKEFRPLDLRSFRSRTAQVNTLYRTDNGFELTLFPNFRRDGNTYLFTHDLNGKFVIETHDNPDDKLQGEYGKVHFLYRSQQLDGDVYIFGGLTDFQLKPEYRMTFNEELDFYEADVWLKNGFYDYYYAFVPSGADADALPDLMEIEGSTFEAENDYLILVYYRPFGSRYDQLVAIEKINSNPNR